MPRLLALLIAVAVVISIPPVPAWAGYVAVSLSQMEKTLRAGTSDKQALELGGINRILGVVIDPDGDVVLVGRRDPSAPPLLAEHLAVALRAPTPPLVSLDDSADTPRTGQLRVRFEGGVEHTRLGSDILKADIELKRLALGLASARIWGVPSYLDVLAASPETANAHVRFWFTPRDNARLIKRDGVFYIRRLDVAVQTEAVVGQSPEAADRFAAALQGAFQDVAIANSALARVKPLFDIVAVATAIRDVRPPEALAFWLKDYVLPPLTTPETFDSLINRAEARGGAVEITGGVDLKTIFAGVEAGDSSALRQAVLLSRPDKAALSWPVPIAAWPTEGPPALRADADQRQGETALSRRAAASARSSYRDDPVVSQRAAQYVPPGVRSQAPLRVPPVASAGSASAAVIASHAPVSDTGLDRSRRPSPSYSVPTWQTPPMPQPRHLPPPAIGGVWLSGVAHAAPGDVRLGPSGGGFSLMIDREDAALPSDRFARFVTALWAVYLSKTPPGISIDPIGKDLPKHLVRYIGNVMNSDLGRVMREADYAMKQLAVGSKPLNVPGFRDVDSLTGRHGLTYAGASRRFWFVPEELRFLASEGMLRFDGGRMTLKTAYVMQGGKTVKSEPADDAFARFFTENYAAIAAKQPIFDDLLDYGRLVGLAAYLKQQGVPMLWFLLAYRDFLLTEDSPGSVDAIVRQSKVYEGMRIEGGVNMGERGRYLDDPQVADLLRQASRQTDRRQAVPPAILRETGAGGTDMLLVGARSYTVARQASQTAGRDSAGRRYQTDIVRRKANGEPGLELVRYFDPARKFGPVGFGNGWSLLVPYSVARPQGDYVPFSGGEIRRRMVVIDELTGYQEELVFAGKRYAIAGWVPEDPKRSRLIGLFPLSDGSFRLADKIGSEYAFDPSGHMTKMMLSDEYKIGFNWVRQLEADAFVRPPYRVVPDGTDRTEWRDAELPTRIRIVGAFGSETMELRRDGRVLAYAPRGDLDPKRFVAIMSDGSFRMHDGNGGEAVFGRDGRFVRWHPRQAVVAGLNQDEHQVQFRFTMTATGDLVVAEASADPTSGDVVRYHYGDDGALMIAASGARP